MPFFEEVKNRLDEVLGMPPRVLYEHAAALAPLIDRQGSLKIIHDVVADEKALDEISARSYTHTLGFKKIVLLDPGLELADGRKGYGYQLRPHIWQPESDSGVPLVESMHEHSFDFFSHLLIGQMENQTYRFRALSQEQQSTLEKLKRRLSELSDADTKEVNVLLESMESDRLQAFGSRQAELEGPLSAAQRQRLRELLQLTDQDLACVVGIEGRYQSVSSGVESGGYVHRLVETGTLCPHAVLKINAGDFYYHPHPFAHRLYIRAGHANATMLVTTPVSQEALGGSFQRPSWVPGTEVSYKRKMYTADELKDVLLQFAEELESMPAESMETRMWDVESAASKDMSP